MRPRRRETATRANLTAEQLTELRVWEAKVRARGGSVTDSVLADDDPLPLHRRSRRAGRPVDLEQCALITQAALEAARTQAAATSRPGRLDVPCPRCGVVNRCGWNGYGRGHCRGCRKRWIVAEFGEE